MSEVRLAQKNEIVRQKEIWKRCFGDEDSFIDFYYANRYKEDATLLLLEEEEIAAMLTMIPVKMVETNNRSFDTAMLYAIATHPEYQNRGLATQLMNSCNGFLGANHKEFSILVPAKKQLFDFYRRQGYREGFYIRETLLTRDQIESLDSDWSNPYIMPPILPMQSISPITPEEYNHRRDKQLKGRLYIAYSEEEISYQKRLSQLSGADIYAIDVQGIQGCAAIERINLDQLLIKEILLPDEFITQGVRQIAQFLPAKEYLIRTPAYLGEALGGDIRAFAMIRSQKEMNLEITPAEQGYLGFAFD